MKHADKNTADLLGYSIWQSPAEAIARNIYRSRETLVANTINPHSYVVAKRDSRFRGALRNSDFLIPDGVGIVIAHRLTTGKKIKRVTGMDLFFAVMREVDSRAGKVFFLGSSEKALKKIIERAAVEYPSVVIKALSPPYRDDFEATELMNFCDAIESFQPDVVFVGLTAPKQEKLIEALRPYCNVKLMCGIGAVFDFYAETVRRPAGFWQRWQLEWLARLIRDPRRLYHRTFYSAPIFIFDVASQIWERRRS